MGSTHRPTLAAAAADGLSLRDVHIEATSVDDYLTEAPEDRRELLRTMRAGCRDLLTGFAESMAYGMPSYSRNGEIEIAFASQKQYVSLYVLRTDVLDAHRDQLVGLNVGKSCVRYRRPDQVDQAVLRSMLEATARTAGPVC